MKKLQHPGKSLTRNDLKSINGGMSARAIFCGGILQCDSPSKSHTCSAYGCICDAELLCTDL